MSSQAAANVLCVMDDLLSGRDRQTDKQAGLSVMKRLHDARPLSALPGQVLVWCARGQGGPLEDSAAILDAPRRIVVRSMTAAAQDGLSSGSTHNGSPG